MSNDLSAFFGGTPYAFGTVEPQADIDIYPPGKYPVLIEKAEVRQTKKKNGHLIALELQILNGPHRGRKLYDNINIENPSEQCVEIGMRVFEALGRAIGLPAITNTDQLLNQTVVAHVKVDKGGQNNVRTYSAAGQQTAAPAVAPATPVQPAQQQTAAPPVSPITPAASGAKKPWER